MYPLIMPLFIMYLFILIIIIMSHYHHRGGARGVMVIVAGYRHGDTSSNPGPD